MRSRIGPSIHLVVLVAALAACHDSSNESKPDASSNEPEHFSFFVASLRALQELSGNEAGFGGDLRYGETGPGAGLRGADKICSEIAERSMRGASKKRWRAFLSATAGEDGTQVNAIDRIGEGPWYDRLGRVFAETKADLLNDRPATIDPAIAHDFPNEDGVKNQKPDPDQPSVDNHDILTGTNSKGELYSPTATCKDWTSALGEPETEGRPRVGHSWDRMASDVEVVRQFGQGRNLPDGAVVEDGGILITPDHDGGLQMGPPRPVEMMMKRSDGPGMQGGSGDSMRDGSGHNWMSALDEAGCAPGINLIQDGPPKKDIPTVGSGGGYGGIYCFALTP